tara:strand:- start:84 stop:623 length:540 start_codon:yes stop_codon:yes gene_type:complete
MGGGGALFGTGGLGGGTARGVRGVPQPGDDPSTYLLREILAQQMRRRESMKMNKEKEKTYSFEEPHKSGGDYEVGEGPAVSSGYQEPENTDTHIGAVGRGERRSEPEPEEHTGSIGAVDRGEGSKRDEMKIGESKENTNSHPKRDGRKGRRGRKGRDKTDKDKDKNYYDEQAEGTGLHT